MKIVQMEVTVTVTPPKGRELSDEQAVELAMQSVTQTQHVEHGRDASNQIEWANVYAEVSDADCEVIE
jgi:hypothetical protein